MRGLPPLLACLLLAVPGGAPGAERDLAPLEAALHREVNALRRRAGRVPLLRDPALDAVARAHSRDMARRGYLAHVDPEGRSPLDRLREAGISGFTLAAENAGRSDRRDAVVEIVRGWVASPTHHRNLFLPAFNRTGIGVARGPEGAIYATQLYVTVPRAGRASPAPPGAAPGP